MAQASICVSLFVPALLLFLSAVMARHRGSSAGRVGLVNGPMGSCPCIDSTRGPVCSRVVANKPCDQRCGWSHCSFAVGEVLLAELQAGSFQITDNGVDAKIRLAYDLIRDAIAHQRSIAKPDTGDKNFGASSAGPLLGPHLAPPSATRARSCAGLLRQEELSHGASKHTRFDSSTLRTTHRPPFLRSPGGSCGSASSQSLAEEDDSLVFDGYSHSPFVQFGRRAPHDSTSFRSSAEKEKAAYADAIEKEEAAAIDEALRISMMDR